MLRAIIFDMDGVLLDSETLHYHVIYDMMTERGYTYTVKHLQKYCGVPEEEIWEPLLKELGGEHDDPLQAQEEHWARYRKRLEKNGLPRFPGTEDCLRALQQRYRLAVASASSVEVIDDYMNRLGYTDYFDCIISAQYCEHGKPEPDVFLLASEQLGVPPQDCLVVEDSRNGMIAAQRAGMKWVGFSGAEVPTDMSYATFTFSDYRDVKPCDFEKWYTLMESR
ncbi:MAG: HAD family phosphatase [Eubacteriales bacterium]|nr:HAD family phosphatase [Eubacteriales bacterium]